MVSTIGGLVAIRSEAAIGVIGAGLAAAVLWNSLTWALGLPSSSGHAIVGGLTGAALVEGGVNAVTWSAGEASHSLGVLGTLVALAASPPLGFLAAFLATRGLRRSARRLTSRWNGVVRSGQWLMSGLVALSHGANDAAKSIGVIAALLLADGRVERLSAPLWATVGCSLALTAGTALGGWRVVRTLGRRIYPVRSLDALGAQGASAAVIFGSTLLGAPVSTTQVVASSVVGAGAGRRRWHHVRWTLVGEMGLAWLVTVPAAATLAAAVLLLWRAFA